MNSAPSVALLDVNETLSDLAPLAERFEDVGAPGDLLPTWFAATLRDGIALAASGQYADFPDVARAALHTLLARVGGPPLEEAAEHVLAGMAALSVHPDVEPGLRRLREAGIRAATLTNGSAAAAEALLERAGIADLVERYLDVSEVGRWKPAPEPYRHACRTMNVAEGDAALIAVHPWDVHGARRAGLRGAWLDRHRVPYPSFFLAPDVSASDLPTLVDRLSRRSTRGT
jgi:2-haloacid dehalogenase